MTTIKILRDVGIEKHGLAKKDEVIELDAINAKILVDLKMAELIPAKEKEVKEENKEIKEVKKTTKKGK